MYIYVQQQYNLLSKFKGNPGQYSYSNDTAEKPITNSITISLKPLNVIVKRTKQPF